MIFGREEAVKKEKGKAVVPSFVTLSKRLSHRSGVFDRRSVCIHDDAHQICNGAGIGFYP